MQKYLSSKIITCKLTWYQKWVQQNFQTLYFFSIGELDVALTLTFVSQLKLVRRTSKTPDKLVEHVNPAKNMGLRMCLGHFWVQVRVPGLKQLQTLEGIIFFSISFYLNTTKFT